MFGQILLCREVNYIQLLISSAKETVAVFFMKALWRDCQSLRRYRWYRLSKQILESCGKKDAILPRKCRTLSSFHKIIGIQNNIKLVFALIAFRNL